MQRNADATLKRGLLSFAVPAIKDDERKQQVLIETVIQEKTPVAVAAIDCLVGEYPEFAASILLDILPACREQVQGEICANLGRLRDPACIAPLLDIVTGWSKALDDKPSLIICENACSGLGYFDSPEVLELLESLIIPPSKLPWKKTPPARIRNAALTALVMIGGKRVGEILRIYTNDNDGRFRVRVRKFLKDQKKQATQAKQATRDAQTKPTTGVGPADS